MFITEIIRDNAVIFLLLIFLSALVLPVIITSGVKNYKVAIVLLFLSPWIHWFFAENIPKVGEEMLQVKIDTYIRIGILALVGTIGFTKFIQKMRWSKEELPLQIILLGLFLLFGMFSSMYSIERFYTLSRSFQFILYFGFLLGLYVWVNDKTRLDSLLIIFFWVMVLGVILNLCALAVTPDRVWWWQDPNRFQGITGHPNTFGALCMLFYPIVMWRYAKLSLVCKISMLILVLVVVILHLYSGSRSTILTSIIGVSLWFLVMNKKTKLYVFCIFIVMSTMCISYSNPVSLQRNGGTLTDLTGRADFWQGCLTLIKEKPIIGYGYGVGGAVWNDPRFRSKTNYLWMGSSRTSVHNGYLSIAIGLGITGLLLLLIIIFKSIYVVIKLPATSYKALYLVVILEVLIVNMVESTIVGAGILTAIVFWVFIIIAARLTQDIKIGT